MFLDGLYELISQKVVFDDLFMWSVVFPAGLLVIFLYIGRKLITEYEPTRC